MKNNRTESGENRSEQVRQRRSQRVQERVDRAARQVRYPAEAPTVFVRGMPGAGAGRGTSKRSSFGGSFATPVVDRAQSRVRRKVSIPVNSAGVELVMPSLPILQPGWRLLSALLTAVLGFALYTALFTDQFAVGLPEVTGLERLSVDDLESVVELEGAPIFLIDTNQVQMELSDAFPELEAIQVSVSLPDHVAISAVERKPVIAWRFGDRMLWIDAEGAIFPARGQLAEPLMTVQSEVLPPLQAQTVDEIAATQLQEEADEKPRRSEYEFNLYQRIMDPNAREALVLLSQQISAGATLAFSESEGFGWHDERGWDVYMGHELKDLNVKLSVYNDIINQLNQQGIHPVMVSVAHIHAPYYRTE